MKRLFTLLVSVTLGSTVFAQSECENGRYVTYDLFTDVDVTSGVVFGNNISVPNLLTGAPGSPVDLRMDVYQPSGDQLTSRPVVVLQFGGSFIGGSRSQLSAQCKWFARMGYVAVAPDYRVGVFSPNEVNTTLAVMRAMHDMKAVVRYLRKTVAEDGNPYGIDPDRIIVGGVSAGAIGAIHAAYFDKDLEVPSYMENDTAGLGGVEGNSGTPNYPSNVAGVLSFSGAIGDTSWIEQDDVPVLSVHEENDNVVPYNTTEVSVNSIPTGLIASGSRDVHARARNANVSNCLLVYPGVQNHTGYVTGSSFQPEVNDLVRDFCAGLVCGETMNCGNTLNVGIEDTEARKAIAVYPNPATDVLYFRTEEMGSVEVVDAIGRTVISTSAVLGQNQLGIANLPKGAYVMLFKGTTIGTAKFLKE